MTKEKGQRPTITLEDGTVMEADRAVNKWELLKALLRSQPPEVLQSLLALARGRPDDADRRHFETLVAWSLIDEGDHSIDSVSRAVLLNSFVATDAGPVIAPLRLKSAADKVVAEEALAQLHQDYREGSARQHSPGGFLERAPWNKGKGRSAD